MVRALALCVLALAQAQRASAQALLNFAQSPGFQDCEDGLCALSALQVDTSRLAGRKPSQEYCLWINNPGFEDVAEVKPLTNNASCYTCSYEYTTIPEWSSTCCSLESASPATVLILNGSAAWGSVSTSPARKNKHFVGLQFGAAAIGQDVEHKKGKFYILSGVARSRPGDGAGLLRVAVGTSSSHSQQSPSPRRTSEDWCLTQDAWTPFYYCYEAQHDDLTIQIMNAWPNRGCPGQDNSIFVDNIAICETKRNNTNCVPPNSYCPAAQCK